MAYGVKKSEYKKLVTYRSVGIFVAVRIENGQDVPIIIS